MGGAIVFDHFAGTDRFVHRLGERIAAKALLEAPRYNKLYGTWVFFKEF